MSYYHATTTEATEATEAFDWEEFSISFHIDAASWIQANPNSTITFRAGTGELIVGGTFPEDQPPALTLRAVTKGAEDSLSSNPTALIEINSLESLDAIIDMAQRVRGIIIEKGLFSPRIESEGDPS